MNQTMHFNRISNQPETDLRRKSIAVPSLTGIRGVTTIWVALHHMYGTAAALLALPWLAQSSLFANGYRGVDLFFVLSGFILMRSHGRDFKRLNREAIRRFTVARFFRIYPLNTVILLAMVPLVMLAPNFVVQQRSFTSPQFIYKTHNLSLTGFVQSFLLVQTFTFAKLGEWNGPSWSLSAELLGYVLFPILAFISMRQRSAMLCSFGAGLCLVALTSALVLGHHTYDNPTGIFGAVRMFGCFSAGILAHRATEIGHPVGARSGAILTSAAILFITVTMFVPRLTVLDNFGFVLLIAGLVPQSGPVDRILRSRPLMWIGAISFSFYMIQETIFRIFIWCCLEPLMTMPLLVRILALVMLVAVTLLLAWLLFNVVEKPSHRLGRRLAQPSRWSKTSINMQASISKLP